MDPIKQLKELIELFLRILSISEKLDDENIRILLAQEKDYFETLLRILFY